MYAETRVAFHIISLNGTSNIRTSNIHKPLSKLPQSVRIHLNIPTVSGPRLFENVYTNSFNPSQLVQLIEVILH